MRHPRNRETGVMLIEALVGILIFAIGILALIAMQATAIRAAQDSRYRTEAVKYANDLISQMLVSVDRTPANFAASLGSFAHQTGGAECAFTGAVATNPVVTNWAQLVTNSSGAASPNRMPLPGATSAMLQVLVDTSMGAYNRVTITVCWRAPDDAVARKHILVSYVT